MAQTVMFAIGDLEHLVAMCHTQVEHWVFAKNAIIRQAVRFGLSEFLFLLFDLRESAHKEAQ